MWSMIAEGLKLVIWTAFVLLLGILLGFAATERSVFRAEGQPGPIDASDAQVAEQVLPAVVALEVERWIPHPPVFGMESAPDVPIPVPASGSGFVFDDQGHVITNDHVVRGATEVWVHLWDGRQFRADPVGSDPETDIAVLQVRGAPYLPVVKLGDSSRLQVGDWVAAVGNPYGHLSGSFTVGVVSGTRRNEISIRGGAPTYQDFIQTDAAIHFGNSGGPLVNHEGEAIGVNTAFGGAGSGIGFAIPIDLAHEVARSLIENGRVVRGYLGVVLQEVDPELARGLALERIEGAMVREVFPGTPAFAAGIQAGDVILGFGEERVPDMGRFRLLVARASVGETVPVRLFRFGQERVLHVTLNERPGQFELEAGFDPLPPRELGLLVSAASDTSETGVMVDSIIPGGLAERSGLIEGDLIRELDGRPTSDVPEFEAALERAREASRPAVVRVERGGDSWYVALTTPEY
jgi:serine protease Do